MKINNIDRITYSVSDAVRVSSIGRTRIFALMKSGELKSTKVGKRTLISAISLRHLIDPAD